MGVCKCDQEFRERKICAAVCFMSVGSTPIFSPRPRGYPFHPLKDNHEHWNERKSEGKSQTRYQLCTRENLYTPIIQIVYNKSQQ